MDTVEIGLFPAAAAPVAAPTLSLLLCTVGRSDQLQRCLAALAAQDAGDFELIVVDQNEPGTLDGVLAPYVARLDIRHVHAPRGLSRARNVGLALCRGAIIGFPDDDCWYPPNLVRGVLAEFARRPDIEALSGRTVDAQGRESLGRFLVGDKPIDRRNIWFTGNSNTLFVRAAAARRIGGFDETLGVGAPSPFQSGEETDFLLRILASGGVALYRQNLRVHHDQVAVGTPAVAIRRARAYSRGFGRVLRLHGYALSYVAHRLLRTLASGALAMLRGDAVEGRVKFVWAAGTVVGFFSGRPVAPQGEPISRA